MTTSKVITTSQVERIRRDWVQMAGGESVTVEYSKGTFYGFCTEVAAYRIERKYNCRPKCEAGFSKSRGSWYVRLETNLGASSPDLTREAQLIKQIVSLFDGVEWDSDTASTIANMLTEEGYVIRDPNEEQDDGAAQHE